MGAILVGLLKMVGWQFGLKVVWRLAHPELVKLAKRSDTKFDDKLIDIFDKVINVAVTIKKK